MKIGYLLLAALLPLVARAQNVGVGTTAPQAPLHVVAPPGVGYGPDISNRAIVNAPGTLGNPARLTDDNLTSPWFSGSLPQVVQFDFGNQPATLRQYRLYSDLASPASPGAWRFEGSADGTAWTTLHAVSAQSQWAGWQSFAFANAVAYPYYRFVFTNAQAPGGNVVRLAEVELQEAGPPAPALRLNSTARLDGLASPGGAQVVVAGPDGTLGVSASLPPGTSGDNLGNHRATTDLNLDRHVIFNAGRITSIGAVEAPSVAINGLAAPAAALTVGGNATVRGNLAVDGTAFVGLQHRTYTYSLAGNNRIELFIACPAGTRLLSGGGGHTVYNSAARDIRLSYNGPDPANPLTRWRLVAHSTAGSARGLSIYCLCARIQ